MKQRYDVIVVGAGPAGLLAAKAAAENGLEVALLRKKNLAVVQRSCGQSMVSMNEYYLGDLLHFNGKDGRICFPTTGFSFAYTGSCRPLYSWQFFSPGMNMIQFGLSESEALKKGQPLIGMVYDKEVLLANLRDQMIRDRVTVLEGTELTDIALQGKDVVVQAGGKELHSACVIAADGTNSRVVEKLGFNQERKLIGTLYAQSFFIRGFTPPGSHNTISGFAFTEQGERARDLAEQVDHFAQRLGLVGKGCKEPLAVAIPPARYAEHEVGKQQGGVGVLPLHGRTD